MWIRKSKQEIDSIIVKQVRLDKSVVRPIIFGIVFGLVFMVLYAFAFRGITVRSGGYDFSSPGSFFAPNTIFAGAFGFFLFSGLAFYYQKRGSSLFSKEKSFVCVDCGKFTSTESQNCGCGGKLEPSEFFTWNDSTETI